MSGTAYLPVIRSNAELDLIELLRTVDRLGVTLDGILRICHLYRVRGIAALLLNADVKEFHGDLRKSGQAFLHFLQSVDETSKLTSKADPFFDAIASKDFGCAREIALRSRSSWALGEEFEDDFLYVRVLMKLFFLESGDPERQELVEGYRQVANAGIDPRVAVCLALAKGSEMSFDEALQAFLTDRRERYQRLAAMEAVVPEDLATEASVSCEGLALIRLAEGKGMVTQREYLFIPSIVREVPVHLNTDWRMPRSR